MGFVPPSGVSSRPGPEHPQGFLEEMVEMVEMSGENKPIDLALGGRNHVTSKARYLALDGLTMSDLFKQPGGNVV